LNINQIESSLKPDVIPELSVSTATKRDVIQQGLVVLRKKGVLAAIRAGLRVLNLNYQGYWWYLRYLYRAILCQGCRTSEPFSIIHVDPKQITHRPSIQIGRWDDLGAVIDGDWDRSERTVGELIKYRSVVDHFGNGTPWEETDVYREAIKRIDRGESFWNGSLTEDDIDERIAHLETLFDQIQTDGFKSQEELEGKPLREIVLDRKFDRSKEEIAVAIGRDGKPLFVDGNHRLAIATVLEIDRIPVHVIARHERWQALREEVAEAESLSGISLEAREHLTHCDMPKMGGSKRL